MAKKKTKEIVSKDYPSPIDFGELQKLKVHPNHKLLKDLLKKLISGDESMTEQEFNLFHVTISRIEAGLSEKLGQSERYFRVLGSMPPEMAYPCKPLVLRED